MTVEVLFRCLEIHQECLVKTLGQLRWSAVVVGQFRDYRTVTAYLPVPPAGFVSPAVDAMNRPSPKTSRYYSWLSADTACGVKVKRKDLCVDKTSTTERSD